MHKIHTKWLMEASSILHRSILSKRTPWILIRRMTSYIEVCFTKDYQNNIKWHYMHTRCNGDAKSRPPHWLVALLWFFWKIFWMNLLFCYFLLKNCPLALDGFLDDRESILNYLFLSCHFITWNQKLQPTNVEAYFLHPHCIWYACNVILCYFDNLL